METRADIKALVIDLDENCSESENFRCMGNNIAVVVKVWSTENQTDAFKLQNFILGKKTKTTYSIHE